MNVNTKFIFTSDKQQQQSRHWIGIVQGKANKVRTWRFASPPTLSNKEQFTRPLLYHLIVGPLQNSFWRSKKKKKMDKRKFITWQNKLRKRVALHSFHLLRIKPTTFSEKISFPWTSHSIQKLIQVFNILCQACSFVICKENSETKT